MHAVTGITGHVGSATARALTQRGAGVRALVRTESRRKDAAGDEVVAADFDDADALAAALRGTEGAFVMLPTLPGGGDAEHRAMADSVAAAVGESGIGHVVALSSIGADHAEGTGPIRWLHHFEERLRATGTVVTAIRSWHFQEKVDEVLGAAVGAGIYPVFGNSADVPTPMIATRDIGTVAAECLFSPPAASEVVDLQGTAYSERDVATQLGRLLGRELEVVTLPREAWAPTLVEAGLSEALAREVAQMYDAAPSLDARGDRSVWCPTPLQETLREVVARSGTGVPA